ncbi:hypothetical protein [Desulfovibrio legallii]|nr:hypothetical protein [Desulfovibrio legallii]
MDMLEHKTAFTIFKRAAGRGKKTKIPGRQRAERQPAPEAAQAACCYS